MEILEDLKRSIDFEFGNQLHPRYRDGVHEEDFLKDKKEIESIYGIEFPKEFYNSFWFLNGLYDFDGLSLFGLDSLEEDNKKYIDMFGDSIHNYIIVGKSSYDFLIYDVEKKGFGVLSFSEWSDGIEIEIIDEDYENFLNEVVFPHLSLEEQEENEEI